jgi:hypothetical protein
MIMILMSAMAAGSVSAAWWPFGGDSKEVPPEEPMMTPTPEPRSAPDKPRMQQRMNRERDMDMSGRNGDRPRMMNPEQMQKMRAEHKAIMDLGNAARNETDPVKKEELVGQLRVKLNEAADKMQVVYKNRLTKAERELAKLKARMAENEARRDERIEGQIQRILAGEPMFPRPEGKGPGAGEGKKHQKAPKPPVEQ